MAIRFIINPSVVALNVYNNRLEQKADRLEGLMNNINQLAYLVAFGPKPEKPRPRSKPK